MQRKIREESYKLFLGPLLLTWSCGVVVITSALHAEGPQFDPGRDQKIFSTFLQILRSLKSCQQLWLFLGSTTKSSQNLAKIENFSKEML